MHPLDLASRATCRREPGSTTPAWERPHARSQPSRTCTGRISFAIPTLIGTPLLLISSSATLFGAWDQISGPAMLLVLPVAIWEFAFGDYMSFKSPAPAVEEARPSSTRSTPPPESHQGLRPRTPFVARLPGGRSVDQDLRT